MKKTAKKALMTVALAGAIALLVGAAFQQKSPLPSEKDFLDAQKKLAGSPDDKADNTTVGRYFGFVLGDFEKAEPFVLKGNDKGLATLIAEEKKDDKNKFTASEIADKWLKEGDKAGNLKPVYRDRAIYWYGIGWERGLSSDPGLSDVVRKRLELLQASPVKQAYQTGPVKGWKFWGGTFIGLKYVRSGKRSLAVAHGLHKARAASNTLLEGTYQAVPATAKGKPFVLTVWALADGTDTAGDSVQLQVADAAGAVILDKVIPMGQDEPYWKRYAVKDAMPEGAARFRLLIHGQSEKGMLYLDDFSLVSDGKENILQNGSFED